MGTSWETRAIAEIMRGELGKANRNSTWFGSVIGRSQSHASQILLGKKAMSVDELGLACRAFGLTASEVMRTAEGLAGDDAWSPPRDSKIS
jgi:hypothetical protein